MTVRVRYLAQLRHAAGCSGEEVDMAGPSSVLQFLTELSRRRPTLRAALLNGQEGIQATLLIFIGEEQAGPDHLLQPGDELTLLTPVAGGGADADRSRAD